MTASSKAEAIAVCRETQGGVWLSEMIGLIDRLTTDTQPNAFSPTPTHMTRFHHSVPMANHATPKRMAIEIWERGSAHGSAYSTAVNAFVCGQRGNSDGPSKTRQRRAGGFVGNGPDTHNEPNPLCDHAGRCDMMQPPEPWLGTIHLGKWPARRPRSQGAYRDIVVCAHTTPNKHTHTHTHTHTHRHFNTPQA